MYDAADTHDLPVQSNNQVYLPATEQQGEGVSRNDEVRVTFYPDMDAVESVTFTRFVTAGNTITIPSKVSDRFEIGDEVTVGFEATGKVWSPQEQPKTARHAVHEQLHPEQQSLQAVTDVVADD